MKVSRRGRWFFWEDFFADNFLAGFTDSAIEGKLPRDIGRTLSFLPGCRSAGYMKQIHSAVIHKVKRGGAREGDGLFTERRGLPLIVKTADCLPLVFASIELGVAGVVHMGWRSGKEGILDKIPYDLSRFKVAAGVGLRKCCYRVGEEFFSYSCFGGFLVRKSGGIHFDPVGFARRRLTARGLPEDNFYDSGICSFCDPRRFPSWRRDKAKGRTLSFIMTAGQAARQR